MPSRGIRCLAELRENYSRRDNDCYSNYYSECLVRGTQESLQQVCGPCARGGGWGLGGPM